MILFYYIAYFIIIIVLRLGLGEILRAIENPWAMIVKNLN